MIGKGQAISRTKASISYGWNQEKDAEVVFKQHLAGDNPQEIAEEFRIIQSENERCTKNTLSFVVSPTIEDGKKMTPKDLGKVAGNFIKELKLQNHQAIAFVHRDKQHTHIHIYTNRISLSGETYKDNFIGKRSQVAADNVAKELNLTRVRDVQQQKEQQFRWQRNVIYHKHQQVLQSGPRSLDSYMDLMKKSGVSVQPVINKSNQLQGFRFQFQDANLKGSSIHRQMSGNKIIADITRNDKALVRLVSKQPLKELQMLDKTVQLSTGMAKKIVLDLVKQVIKKSIDIELGI